MTRAMPMYAGRTDWTPPEEVVELVAAIAAGELDQWSGRFLRAGADDLDTLRATTPEGAGRQLRLQPYGTTTRSAEPPPGARDGARTGGAAPATSAGGASTAGRAGSRQARRPGGPRGSRRRRSTAAVGARGTPGGRRRTRTAALPAGAGSTPPTRASRRRRCRCGAARDRRPAAPRARADGRAVSARGRLRSSRPCRRVQLLPRTCRARRRSAAPRGPRRRAGLSTSCHLRSRSATGVRPWAGEPRERSRSRPCRWPVARRRRCRR